MFISNRNKDCESVDFVDDERNHINMYKDLKKKNYSKIVTKAVIENTPSKLIDNINHVQSKHLKRNNDEDSDDSRICKNHNISSSPSSSLEKTFLDSASFNESLLNCLAYNDNHTYETQEPCSFSLEDKECSNNSLSDSTITTVTSDLTNVSPYSCLSDSSCVTDSSFDSSPLLKEYENDCTEDCKTSNHSSNQLYGNFNSNIESSDKESIDDANIDEKSDLLDYERCRSESLNKLTCDNGNIEDILGNGCIKSIDPTIDNEDDFGSEKLQEPIEVKDGREYDNDDNYVDKSVFINNYKENSSELVCYESDYESESIERGRNTSDKSSNISILEAELGDISLATELSSNSCPLKTPFQCRGSKKLRVKRKVCNLSFSREELIKIERDNLTLLKKIMAHSKPRTMSRNQTFCHKKTSAAINRAKQQKKIDEDNYILYSKINAIGRMKKVF